MENILIVFLIMLSLKQKSAQKSSFPEKN